MNCVNCGFEMVVTDRYDGVVHMTSWQCVHCGCHCFKAVSWFDSFGRPLTAYRKYATIEIKEE